MSAVQQRIDEIKRQQRALLDRAEQYPEGSAQYRQLLAQFDDLQRERERLAAERDRTAPPAGLTAEERARETAYHESAHCIAARALGARVLSATIIPDSKTNGLMRHSLLDPFGNAVVSFAGRFGGRLAGVNVGREDQWCQGDELGAADDLAGYPDLQEQARRRARELVNTHAGAVGAVANALLTHGTLSGAQVHGICRAYGL